MKSKLLSLTIAAFVAITINMQAQVTFFSGFENWAGSPTNPTDWMGAPATNITPDSVMQVVTTGTVVVEQGTFSCKLKNVSATHKRMGTQPLAVVNGQAYQITYYARGKGSIRAGIYTGKIDTTGGQYAYSYAGYQTINSKTWRKFVQTLIADTSNLAGQFILSVKSTSTYTNSSPMIVGVDVDSFNVTTYTPQNNVTLYNIQYTASASGNSPFYGQYVNHTGGIVTMITKSSSGSPNGYYLQTTNYNTWGGCLVFDYTNSPNVAIGDSVTLNGAVDEYFNMTELNQVNTFVKVSSGNTIMPAVITTQILNQEMYESILVGVNSATCNTYTAAYGEWTATDISGVPGNVVTKTDYLFAPNIGSIYCIEGPVNYSFSNFTITPRFASDVKLAACAIGIHTYSNNMVAEIYPNPMGNDLTIKLPFISQKANISFVDVLGKEVLNTNASGSEFSVNATNLSAGVYMVKITADEKTQMVKVIKQ